MDQISVIEKTKEYVVVRIPRRLAGKFGTGRHGLTEVQALRILEKGLSDARLGKGKKLNSLKDLR